MTRSRSSSSMAFRIGATPVGFSLDASSNGARVSVCFTFGLDLSDGGNAETKKGDANSATKSSAFKSAKSLDREMRRMALKGRQPLHERKAESCTMAEKPLPAEDKDMLKKVSYRTPPTFCFCYLNLYLLSKYN